MKPRTKHILRILHILSWVIFIGLCARAGIFIYTLFISLDVNSDAVKNLYSGLNLSELYKYSRMYYVILVASIIIISALRAFIFYWAIKIFLKINFVHPFSEEVSLLITRIGYMAVGIGFLTLAANFYCSWLINQHITLPDLQSFLGGANEFLLLGAIIYIISQVFKRGIEIQSENELTV